MAILMNPERAKIIAYLWGRKGHPVSYSQVAQDMELPVRVALAHLDLLVDHDLLETHFGGPSVEDEGAIERSFELTDEKMINRVELALEEARAGLTIGGRS